MSVTYSIKGLLSTGNILQEIKEILKNGERIGCAYYPYDAIPEKNEAIRLNIEASADFMIKNIENVNDPSSVLVILEGRAFHINFNVSKSKELAMSLTPAAYIQKVMTEDGFNIPDFSYYLKIFLELTKNLVLKNIKIVTM